MTTQVGTAVGTAITIGTQYTVVLGRHEGTHLLGEGLHVVGRGDGGFGTQYGGDVGHTGGRGRVQHVPAIGVLTITSQLVEGGDAEHVGTHAVFARQDLGGGTDVTQDGATTQQLYLALVAGHGFQLVDTLADAFLCAFRHGRHGIVLVQGGDVVEDVLRLLTVHAAQAVLYDHRHFIGVGRVIGDAVRDGAGQDVAVTIFVLQTFAVEGGTTGGRAQQEATGLLVTGCPRHVADPLEAEHGVVDVERDHRAVVGAVRGRSSQPGGHGAQLVDTVLQNLTLLVFLVVGDDVAVLRGVLLTVRAVDADLAEQTFHTEGTGFVGQDRNDALADGLVFQQHVQGTHERHGGGDLARLLTQQRAKGIQRRDFQLGSALAQTGRYIALQRGTTGVQVLVLFGTLFDLQVRQVFQLLVGDRQAETIAQVTHRAQIHLLDLVSDVLAFGRFAHAITLDGLGQDDGRLALGRCGLGEGGEQFARIVTTAVQGEDLLVGHVFDQSGGFRVTVEEVLTHVAAVTGLHGLIVTIHGLVHQLDQLAGSVFLQQLIPLATPDDLGDIPAGACKQTFQLVDDLAVADNRTVQTLQVAVDHEHQVVELFTHGNGQGTLGFRLVHLAVTQEGVHGLLGTILDATVGQVLQEASLIDGGDGAQTHGNGRELPEVRHQFRVRVGRNALAVHFLTEVVQLLFGQTTFGEGTGVDARGDVTLEVDQIATVLLAASAEEVVVADFIDGRGRGEGRHVTAEVQVFLGGAQHYHHGIPADDGADATFHLQVARVSRFVAGRNGVDVVAIRLLSHVNTANACLLSKLFKDELSALRTLFTQQGFQRGKPLQRFYRVHIVLQDIRHGWFLFCCDCTALHGEGRKHSTIEPCGISYPADGSDAWIAGSGCLPSAYPTRCPR